MNAIIYSTTTCPYCKSLKNYLSERNISFTEKLIDQNDEAKAEMMSESDGFMGVPFSIFSKDDGTKEKVLGFDKGKINKILGIS